MGKINFGSRKPRSFKSSPALQRALSSPVEGLEGRFLLSGTFQVEPSLGLLNTTTSPTTGAIVIASGAQAVAQTEITMVASDLPDADYDEITGPIILQWYNGGGIASITQIPDYPGNISSPSNGVNTPVTISQADAGTPISKGPLKGDYILTYYYGGDANFAPSPQFDSADFATAEAGGGITGTALVVQFSGTAPVGAETQAAFIQQPQNTAVGATIQPPVTVAVEDANGNIVTTSASTVSLSLSGGDGTGTLSGTTTAVVANGVATFNNLSVNAVGSYNLIATDTSVVSSTPVLSSSFNIADTALVFLNQPAPSNNPGDPLSPAIQVELEDGSGNAVATNDGSVVTLSLVGVNSANPITGTTATLSGGVATFSNIVLTKPGTYQLQASDSDGDIVATTNKFGITGDKLVFVGQPKGTDVNDPLAMKIEALTPKGKRDTTLTDNVQLSLNVTSGSSTATLAGNTTASFVAGIATFGTAAGISIDMPGTYTLTATAANTDGTDYTVSTATSAKVKITGVTLKSIAGTVDSQKATSTNDGLTITDADVFAIPQSSEVMSFLAAGLSPSTSKVRQKINWTIERNSADIATGATPALTVNSANPLAATVALNGTGSFNVICYYDANSNGIYDPGEEIKVFHLAEVGVIINTSASNVTTNNSYFAATVTPADTDVVSGTFTGNFAITFSQVVEVLGGGSDGMIGVDKIHLGYVQNGVADSVTVQQTSGRTAKEKLTAGTFPILDANYRPNRLLPYAIFTLPPQSLQPLAPSPGPTRDPVTTATDPNGGEDRAVVSADSPTIDFANSPFGSTPVSITGSNDFVTYLTAYSDDFNRSYIGQLKVSWSASFQFSKSLLGTLQNAGSNVTDSVSYLATPTTLASLGVKTTGTLFAGHTIII